MQTSCIYDELACLQNEDCFIYDTCVVACGSTKACVDSCSAQFPQGPDLTLELAACSMKFCPAVCN